MKKHNSGISGAFDKSGFSEKDVKVIMAKPGAMAIEHAFNGQVRSRPVAIDLRNEQMNWQQAHDFVDILSNFVFRVTKDFNDVVQLVTQMGGPDRPADYERITKTAVSDIDRFTDELVQLKGVIAGKHGFIETPEDNMEYIRIFEKLEGFNAYFQGVTHHLMIEMTEFSLEAKDRMVKREAEKAANEGAV